MKAGSKKWTVLCGLLIVGITAYCAAGPFYTIHQIKVGIEEQDSERLAENIDFPMLRSNLKDQFNALMATKAATDMTNQQNAFGALGMMIASKLVENMVDAMLTPSGLANLMAGNALKQSQTTSFSSPQPVAPKEDPFRNARYSYDSLSKFSIWVTGRNEKPIRVIITRDGLSWRLSNIVMPVT